MATPTAEVISARSLSMRILESHALLRRGFGTSVPFIRLVRSLLVSLILLYVHMYVPALSVLASSTALKWPRRYRRNQGADRSEISDHLEICRVVRSKHTNMTSAVISIFVVCGMYRVFAQQVTYVCHWQLSPIHGCDSVWE